MNCVSTAVTLASATKAKTAVSALCSVVSAECTPLHQAIQNTRPLKLQEIKIRSGDNCIELKIERHTVFLEFIKGFYVAFRFGFCWMNGV
jgi:hypothetical protein